MKRETAIRRHKMKRREELELEGEGSSSVVVAGGVVDEPPVRGVGGLAKVHSIQVKADQVFEPLDTVPESVILAR